MNETKAGYSDSEVRERLERDLPRWQFDDGCITRKYRTEGWKGALMVANTVAHLAEAAWHHPDLVVTYGGVEVRLHSHDAKGITARDFELARRIEEVIHWQPAREGGSLTGTPTDDPRFSYIVYD